MIWVINHLEMLLLNLTYNINGKIILLKINAISNTNFIDIYYVELNCNNIGLIFTKNSMNSSNKYY